MRAQNPLEINAQCGRKSEGETLRQQHPAPNQCDPETEDRAMADFSQYGESTPVIKDNQEQPDTWQPIGGAA
jgi:hypothetical protein